MSKDRHATGRRVRRDRAARITLLLVLATAAIIALPRLEHHLLTAACPIVYVAAGGHLHMTSESGRIDVELEGPPAAARPGRPYSPPAWSPAGDYVGYQCLNPWDGTSHAIVLHPWSGKSWVHANARGTRFQGWSHDESWIEGERLRDARTGNVVTHALQQTVPVRPMYLAGPWGEAVGCDLTEEGNMLANVREKADWQLMVFDSNGNLLRRIETEARPMAESAASWRRKR